MRALLSHLKNEKESFIKRYKDRLEKNVIFDAIPESIQTSISITLIDAIIASFEKRTFLVNRCADYLTLK